MCFSSVECYGEQGQAAVIVDIASKCYSNDQNFLSSVAESSFLNAEPLGNGSQPSSYLLLRPGNGILDFNPILFVFGNWVATNLATVMT